MVLGRWKDEYHERASASMVILEDYFAHAELCGVMLITKAHGSAQANLEIGLTST